MLCAGPLGRALGSIFRGDNVALFQRFREGWVWLVLFFGNNPISLQAKRLPAHPA